MCEERNLHQHEFFYRSYEQNFALETYDICRLCALKLSNPAILQDKYSLNYYADEEEPQDFEILPPNIDEFRCRSNQLEAYLEIEFLG